MAERPNLLVQLNNVLGYAFFRSQLVELREQVRTPWIDAARGKCLRLRVLDEIPVDTNSLARRTPVEIVGEVLVESPAVNMFVKLLSFVRTHSLLWHSVSAVIAGKNLSFSDGGSSFGSVHRSLTIFTKDFQAHSNCGLRNRGVRSPSTRCHLPRPTKE